MAKKITIEIPEWAENRNINILAGIELLARKPGTENKLYVKVVNCNWCGKCCMNLDSDRHPFPVIDGRCIHLKRRPGKEEKYLCGLGTFRPYNCCVSDPTYMEECVIKHEVIELEG